MKCDTSFQQKLLEVLHRKAKSQHCDFQSMNLFFFQTMTCFHSTTKQCIIGLRDYEINYYVNGALLAKHTNAINMNQDFNEMCIIHYLDYPPNVGSSFITTSARSFGQPGPTFSSPLSGVRVST